MIALLTYSTSQETGYDTDYHPADLHPAGSQPADTEESGQALSASEASKKDGVSEKSHERTSTTSSVGTGTSTSGKEGKKKVGFMDKMKGEAKVLLGHLERGKKGEEKVEEGKRMKSGLPSKRDSTGEQEAGKA